MKYNVLSQKASQFDWFFVFSGQDWTVLEKYVKFLSPLILRGLLFNNTFLEGKMKNLRLLVVLAMALFALMGCDNSNMVSTPPDQDEAGGEVIMEGGAPEVQVSCAPSGDGTFVTESGTQFVIAGVTDNKVSDVLISNYSKSEEVVLDQLSFTVNGKGDCFMFFLYHGAEKIGTGFIVNGKIVFRNLYLRLMPWTAIGLRLITEAGFFCNMDTITLYFDVQESRAWGLSSGLDAELWSPKTNNNSAASYNLTAVKTMPGFGWCSDTPTGQAVGGRQYTVGKFRMVNPITDTFCEVHLKALEMSFVSSFSVHNVRLTIYKSSISAGNKIAEEIVSWEENSVSTISLPLYDNFLMSSGSSKDFVVTLDTNEAGSDNFLFLALSGATWSDSYDQAREFYELPSIPLSWKGLEY